MFLAQVSLLGKHCFDQFVGLVQGNALAFWQQLAEIECDKGGVHPRLRDLHDPLMVPPAEGQPRLPVAVAANSEL